MRERLHLQGMRVYWEDTDAGGIVFYANYLKFFERARTEWLRTLGHSQEALRVSEHDGAVFVVTDTQVSYRSPARLDDWLEVSVELVRAGAASLTIRQQACRDQELLAEGVIRIGCVDPVNLKPRRIPVAVMEALKAS